MTTDKLNSHNSLVSISSGDEEIGRRRVGYDEINGKAVSTIFLDLNSGFGDSAVVFNTAIFPTFFETAILSHEGDIEIVNRYSTWDEAKAGHDAICAELRAGIH